MIFEVLKSNIDWRKLRYCSVSDLLDAAVFKRPVIIKARSKIDALETLGNVDYIKMPGQRHIFYDANRPSAVFYITRVG